MTPREKYLEQRVRELEALLEKKSLREEELKEGLEEVVRVLGYLVGERVEELDGVAGVDEKVRFSAKIF